MLTILAQQEPFTPQHLRTVRAAWQLAALLLLALPADAQALFLYTTNNGSITITRYFGRGGAVAIPNSINDLPVTSIGNSAFADSHSLTCVTIGESVTSIGNSAFARCTSLINATIR